MGIHCQIGLILRVVFRVKYCYASTSIIKEVNCTKKNKGTDSLKQLLKSLEQNIEK